MQIKQVAVLGANLTAAQIAAQIANAGIPTLLFGKKQEFVEKNYRRLLYIKPAPFFLKESAQFITPCNYDEDAELLADADWIIDATGNQPEQKKALFQLLRNDIREDAIFSLSSARFPLSSVADYLPQNVLSRFLVTHFSVPSRRCKLVELVTLPETDAAILETITHFCENRLGKNVLYVKDTPNFIADRIGVFSLMTALHHAKKFKLSIEAVDRLTGSVMGRPKSATFRTIDMLGLENLAEIAAYHLKARPGAKGNAVFRLPPFLKKMQAKGWHGQFSGQGFYKTDSSGAQALDLEKMAYRPLKKTPFDALRLA